MIARAIATGLAFTLTGCGGSAPAPGAPSGPTPPDEPRSGGPMMGYQAEIGALDEGKVQETFQRVSGKLGACFTKGAQRIPYLSGTVSFFVRVAEDGSARFAYLKDSTLGDRDTENCMLTALKATTWPKPEGGEGLAQNDNITFDPGGDERPPVEWSAEQLGEPFAKARDTLSQCRSAAGTGPLKATFYVDTDGRATAVGVSMADEKGEAAVECVVSAVKEIRFPSPGSYASKATVIID